MGASVSNFVTSVAKTIAKGATTALGGMIPVIGPALASGLNSLYKKGGVVTRRFEAGGVVPAGFKAKPINSVSQLVNLNTLRSLPGSPLSTVNTASIASKFCSGHPAGGQRIGMPYGVLVWYSVGQFTQPPGVSTALNKPQQLPHHSLPSQPLGGQCRKTSGKIMSQLHTKNAATAHSGAVIGINSGIQDFLQHIQVLLFHISDSTQ